MDLQIEYVGVEKDEETQVILGHAGFIKAVEDLYEAMAGSVPGAKFGIAFSEASGALLVRSDGNDPGLIEMAEESMMRISAGHTFIILFKGAYPINVMNSIKGVPEVARVYCATSNPLTVLVAKSDRIRSVIGVVDGLPPRGVESDEEKEKRHKLLRDLGYKR